MLVLCKRKVAALTLTRTVGGRRRQLPSLGRRLCIALQVEDKVGTMLPAMSWCGKLAPVAPTPPRLIRLPPCRPSIIRACGFGCHKVRSRLERVFQHLAQTPQGAVLNFH